MKSTSCTVERTYLVSYKQKGALALFVLTPIYHTSSSIAPLDRAVSARSAPPTVFGIFRASAFLTRSGPDSRRSPTDSPATAVVAASTVPWLWSHRRIHTLCLFAPPVPPEIRPLAVPYPPSSCLSRRPNAYRLLFLAPLRRMRSACASSLRRILAAHPSRICSVPDSTRLPQRQQAYPRSARERRTATPPSLSRRDDATRLFVRVWRRSLQVPTYCRQVSRPAHSLWVLAHTPPVTAATVHRPIFRSVVY
jgi:hypothetical protein